MRSQVVYLITEMVVVRVYVGSAYTTRFQCCYVHPVAGWRPAAEFRFSL